DQRQCDPLRTSTVTKQLPQQSAESEDQPCRGQSAAEAILDGVHSLERWYSEHDRERECRDGQGDERMNLELHHQEEQEQDACSSQDEGHEDSFVGCGTVASWTLSSSSRGRRPCRHRTTEPQILALQNPFIKI